MNKLGWHWWPSDTTVATTRLRGPRPLHQPRPLHAGLRPGRQGQHRRHLLAAGPPRRRRAAHPLPGCARSPPARHGMADRRGLLRRRRRRALPAGRGGHPGLQRRRHAAPAAELGVRAVSPNGLANSSGLVGRNLMLHPWPLICGYVDEELDGGRGPHQHDLWSQEFYETDPSRGFLRGYTLQFGRGTGPANPGGHRRRFRPAAAGARPPSTSTAQLLDHRLSIGVACEDLPRGA